MIELDVLSAADAAADRTAAHGPFSRFRAWRSADDLAGTPAAAARRKAEFHPETFAPDGDAGTSRRTFLKVMGASMAMAGLTGCRRPLETIVPYVRKPEDVIEGTPNFYATGFPMAGVLHPLLVESHEGRPTKVEGNPDHPVSRGAADAFAYASLLNLYDPDRARFVYRRQERLAEDGWNTFADVARGLAAQGGALGAGTVVLAEPSSSPTVARLRDRFLTTYPGARWVTLHPHGDDNAALALGGARALPRLSRADVIVSFDSDFLTDGPAAVWNSREYGASRDVDTRGSMSRLYVVESTMTTTGGMADHRKRLRAVDVPFFAAAVAAALGGAAPAAAAAPAAGAPGADTTAVPGSVQTGNAATAPSAYANDPFVQAIAEDVRAAAGRCAFFAGAHQSPQLHALAAALNARFGGEVMEYVSTGETPTPVGPQLSAVARDMAAGNVRLLLCLGTNPAYDLPAELNFAEAIGRVEHSIHVGVYRDETAQRSAWHVPRQHYLEQWGDGRALDGTLSVIQPMIAPLYADAHSEIEVLNALTGGVERPGYDMVRETIQTGFVGQVGGGSFEEGWRTVLHDGFVPGTAYSTTGAPAGSTALAGLTPVPADALELVFRTCPKVHDGAFSNNPWMQEAPEPVTKIVWDNVALISQNTAERLGVRTWLDGGQLLVDRLTLSIGEGSVTLPVFIQPGHADNSVSLSLGYGREIATERVVEGRGLIARVFDRDLSVYREGPLANGVGVNVGPLRPLSAMAVFAGARPEAVSDDYMVVTTQDHGSMEDRSIVRMATLEDYRATPDFARETGSYIEGTPWDEYEPLWGAENSPDRQPELNQALYATEQWGMTIDLNTCSGCNACVVACQSENNIQVVGKDQVGRGREMHWLRLDRYYLGDNDAEPTGMVMQPMLCQHCENAPCESVCPVAATSHSPDGINEMTYNRCIGTRYCANNCPYKVRRFNFYNWSKALPEEMWMGMQPDVTVRFRGVMEKCTFCVQRIRGAQMYAHMTGDPIVDGAITTACQSACASGAIVFGNLNDTSSRVASLKHSPRSYPVLGELATKPRVTYLARLRNPNATLAAQEPASGRTHTDEAGAAAAPQHTPASVGA